MFSPPVFLDSLDLAVPISVEAVSGSSQAKGILMSTIVCGYKVETFPASFDLGGSPMVEEDVFESNLEMEKIMSQEGKLIDFIQVFIIMRHGKRPWVTLSTTRTSAIQGM